jgi:hypothetical protein
LDGKSSHGGLQLRGEVRSGLVREKSGPGANRSIASDLDSGPPKIRISHTLW